MRNPLPWVLQLALLFALEFSVCCGGGYSSGGSPPPPPGQNVSVAIDTNASFQTWDSWGTNLTGPYFFVGSNPTTLINSSMLNSMLDDLTGDLNLTGVRLQPSWLQQAWMTDYTNSATIVNWSFIDFTKTYPAGAGSGEPTIDPLKLHNQVINPFLARVRANGWTPKTYIDPLMPDAQIPAFLQASPGKYATFVQAYILWLQGNTPLAHPAVSLTPDRATVTNEPDQGGGRSASEVNTFSAALAARFGSMGIQTKLQIPELWHCDSAFATTAVGSLSSVAMISSHAYDYQNATQPSAGDIACRNGLRDLAANIGAKTAMTEICCWSTWTTNWSAGQAAARDIYWNMTEMNISEYQYFGAWFNPAGNADCSASRGGILLVVANDLSRYSKCAQYYAHRQFSHWIHPGYVRVGATCSGCTSGSYGLVLKPVAFRSPSGKLVVVAISEFGSSQTVTVTGLPAGTYDIVGIDASHATSPVSYPAQTISGGQTLSFAFPAQAIVTFAQR